MQQQLCVASLADHAEEFLCARARLLRRITAPDALIDAWTAYRIDQKLPPEQRQRVARPPIPIAYVQHLHLLAHAALRELDGG